MQVYPMVQRYASDLKQAALAVCNQTDREDLRTMANMYSNNLEGEMKRAGRCVVATCASNKALLHVTGFRVRYRKIASP